MFKELNELFQGLGLAPELGYLILGFFLGFLISKVRACVSSPENLRSAFKDRSPQVSVTTTSTKLDITPETMEQINQALAKRNIIEAIKILREATGLGLAESKNIIEALSRNSKQ